MVKTIVSSTNLNVGDVVEYYGARFKIISTGESRSHIKGIGAYGMTGEFIGPSPVATPIGKFISGQPVNCYFGQDKNFSFQGNVHNRFCRVE